MTMDEPAFAAHIGDTYRIERRLGSGGGGIVYMARHMRMDRLVAIKEALRPDGCGYEARRHEAQALMRMKSMYLPQVYDFIIEGPRAYTVMEFIAGESFDKLLERGYTFTEAQISGWYLQLALALATLHRHCVRHRDIKPSNVMLTPGGDICLIDFGSAIVGDGDPGLLSRSPGYASPEQQELFDRIGVLFPVSDEPCRQSSAPREACRINTVMGGCADTLVTAAAGMPLSRYIDWRLSDIYSLGATIFHLATGRRLPEDAGDAAVDSILELSGKSTTAGTPSRLTRIIAHSLRADPSDRYPSADELIKALREV